MTTHDEETATPSLSDSQSFEDTATRHNFIRRVVCLIIAQLVVISVSALIALKVASIRDFMRAGSDFYPIYFYSLIILISTYLISSFAIVANPSLSKRSPISITLFCVVTVSLAVLLSVDCTYLGIEPLITVFWIILSSCIGIVIFCFNTHFYLISWPSLVYCLLWGYFSCTFMIQLSDPTAVPAMLFMLFLVADITRMIHTSPVTGLTPENYLLGAFKLHADFIWLFVAAPHGVALSPIGSLIVLVPIWFAFVGFKNCRDVKELRSMNVPEPKP